MSTSTLVGKYHGQRVYQIGARFFVECLPQPFSSVSAAKGWIDANVCPHCKSAKHTGACK